MADQPPASLMRPLAFGELFDRAISLYVRNFVPFSAIVLVLLAPWAVVQYVIDGSQMGQLSAMIDAIQHGTRPDLNANQPSFGTFGFIIAASLVLVLLLPFVYGAVAMGVARLYTNGIVELRSCYAASLSRWPQLLGAVLMGILMFLGVYFTLVVVAMILTFAGIALATVGKIFVVVAVIMGIVAVLAAIAVFILLYLAITFAMMAIVIERRPVMESIGAGFSRIFARSEIGRALLFAVCAGLISISGSMVVGVFLLLAVMLHQTWLEVLISTSVNTVIYAFSVVLMTIYYYDVRIRREGLDVEAGLASLTAPTA